MPTIRTTIPGDEVSAGCHHCRRRPQRLYSYDHTAVSGAFFCGSVCAELWVRAAGEHLFCLPRPIEVVPRG